MLAGEGFLSWTVLLGAIVGFLVGSISPTMIFAKFYKADVRGTGSGNPGATNASRVMGKKVGITIAVLDILKGFVPAVVFGALSSDYAGEVAGLFAVLGHIFSPWLGFRGGKGVATTLGAILGVHAIWAIPVLAAFGLGFLVTKRIGLSAVAAALALIACGLFWSNTPEQQFFGISLGLLVLIRHLGNIQRALSRSGSAAHGASPSLGEEPPGAK